MRGSEGDRAVIGIPCGPGEKPSPHRAGALERGDVRHRKQALKKNTLNEYDYGINKVHLRKFDGFLFGKELRSILVLFSPEASEHKFYVEYRIFIRAADLNWKEWDIAPLSCILSIAETGSVK